MIAESMTNLTDRLAEAGMGLLEQMSVVMESPYADQFKSNSWAEAVGTWEDAIAEWEALPPELDSEGDDLRNPDVSCEGADVGMDQDGLDLPGSTSTWNPERTFPWLGDSEPCPSPEELAEGRKP